MTSADQRNLKLLILLLFVLGATVFIRYRMNSSRNNETVQAADPKRAATPPAQNEARIRLDLLKDRESVEELGKKNLFQYRNSRPAEAPPPVKPSTAPGTPTASTPPASARPAGPPPPPAIPLKYQGLAFPTADPKSLIGILGDDKSNHFQVVQGTVVMGRYRVTRITETMVEVEDLQSNHKQALPLSKQQP